MPIFRTVLCLCLVLTASPSLASPYRCLVTTALVEQREGLPRGLLYAIALTESGRWDADRGKTHAWPWTIRAKDDAFVLNNKDEAIATVNDLKKAGRQNIDVGCMQINLKYHPEAFPDLKTAFNPVANVSYAAKFLKNLRQEARSWQKAIEYYHSRSKERGKAYRKRVYKRWHTAQIEINKAHQALKKAGLQRIAHRSDEDQAQILMAMLETGSPNHKRIENKDQTPSASASLFAAAGGIEVIRGVSEATSVPWLEPASGGSFKAKRTALWGIDKAQPKITRGSTQLAANEHTASFFTGMFGKN